MRVQVYTDGTQARIFPTGEHFMLCELNATDCDGVDKLLRHLRLCRRDKWQRVDWGFEAKLRNSPHAKGTSEK